MNTIDMAEIFKSVAIVGAGGKMGNGIALLCLEAMALADSRATGMAGSGKSELVLVDKNRAALNRLKEYLKEQMLKYAERNIIELRSCALNKKELVDNGEIIAAFVIGALRMARFETDLSETRSAKLIFEAVFEDADIKRDLYTDLKKICLEHPYFLSNTSSIPISVLEDSTGLEGRILGYHFYNPPAVQKLVEVISSKSTPEPLHALGNELGRIFGKILVPSNDVAGFIGNGHFIREGLFALEKYQELLGNWKSHEAFFLVNKTTQDLLLRPMGIFQLMDYVGLDVFHMIVQTMDRHIHWESFHSALLTQLLEKGIRGGQEGSGHQKNGVLQYDNNRVLAVYNVETGKYVPVDEAGQFENCLNWIKASPMKKKWKKLLKDPNCEEALKEHFSALESDTSPAAHLAMEFFLHSRKIGENLVEQQVAHNQEDVTSVLKNGFFHLYGPVNSLVQGAMA